MLLDRSATTPDNLARKAIGEPSFSEDLPSPASFFSSVANSGILYVKLDKLHGKVSLHRENIVVMGIQKFSLSKEVKVTFDSHESYKIL